MRTPQATIVKAQLTATSKKANSNYSVVIDQDSNRKVE